MTELARRAGLSKLPQLVTAATHLNAYYGCNGGARKSERELGTLVTASQSGAA